MNYKGYFNYLIKGVLKTHHFHAISAGKVKQLEDAILKDPNRDYMGASLVRDYRKYTEGYQPVGAAPSP